jgi:hypothetical protein
MEVVVTEWSEKRTNEDAKIAVKNPRNIAQPIIQQRLVP